MGIFRRRKDPPPCVDGGRLDVKEAEQEARLEHAEAQVADLKARAAKAVAYLEGRRGRNHWRESIEQMIQGAN